MSFREYDIREWRGNPWSTVSDGWMLITAGTLSSWNTMTASWGGFGELWNKDVVFVFVRPTRHTFGFMESSDRFTLSFFDEEHRGSLRICGSVSGRDVDKASKAKIHPLSFGEAMNGATGVGFEEARLELLCRKLHAQDIDPERFVDPAIHSHYPAKDWHRLYVGEIERARIRE